MIIKNYADKMRDEMMSIELNDNVASSDIKEVLESMGKVIQKSYAMMTEDELLNNYFFVWDKSKSVLQNTYEFTKLLDLYKGSCRRWEEQHNGHSCVVERVRDKYLMPRINDFLFDLYQHQEMVIFAPQKN